MRGAARGRGPGRGRIGTRVTGKSGGHIGESGECPQGGGWVRRQAHKSVVSARGKSRGGGVGSERETETCLRARERSVEGEG